MGNTVKEHIGEALPAKSQSRRVVKSGGIARLAMAVSVALMAALGTGCGSNPNSIERCIGKKEGVSAQKRLSRLKSYCKAGTDSYVGNTDGEDRVMLKAYAQDACSRYGKELYETGLKIEAAKEEASQEEDLSRMNSCSKASNVTRERIKELTNGDVERIVNQ